MFKIITFVIIWTEFKRAAYWSRLRDRKKQYVKGNLSKYRKKNCNFWEVRYFKWRKFLSSTLFFLYRKLNPNVTAVIPLSSLYGISCRFEFHNLWRAWNRQHWLFYNLALFSIYGNDGTAISTWGVIININKYRWEKVSEVNPCRKLKSRTMILFI